MNISWWKCLTLQHWYLGIFPVATVEFDISGVCYHDTLWESNGRACMLEQVCVYPSNAVSKVTSEVGWPPPTLPMHQTATRTTTQRSTNPGLRKSCPTEYNHHHPLWTATPGAQTLPHSLGLGSPSHSLKPIGDLLLVLLPGAFAHLEEVPIPSISWAPQEHVTSIYKLGHSTLAHPFKSSTARAMLLPADNQHWKLITLEVLHHLQLILHASSDAL